MDRKHHCAFEYPRRQQCDEPIAHEYGKPYRIKNEVETQNDHEACRQYFLPRDLFSVKEKSEDQPGQERCQRKSREVRT